MGKTIEIKPHLFPFSIRWASVQVRYTCLKCGEKITGETMLDLHRKLCDGPVKETFSCLQK